MAGARVYTVCGVGRLLHAAGGAFLAGLVRDARPAIGCSRVPAWGHGRSPSADSVDRGARQETLGEAHWPLCGALALGPTLAPTIGAVPRGGLHV